MTVYLNLKTNGKVETVDSFTKGSDNSPSTSGEFRRYVSQMVREYWLSGMNVYASRRCTKEWNNK